MKAFTQLYNDLDQTTKTLAKVKALVSYFQQVSAADAAWALYFLSGRRLKQPIPSNRLRQFCQEYASISAWLFDECYDAVGDLSETVALLLPPPTQTSATPLHIWVEQCLSHLRDMAEAEQRQALFAAWDELDQSQRYIWNKLITGQFRVGVSQQLVVRALSQVSGLLEAVISHRLMGEWQPTPEFFTALIATENSDKPLASQPYPFYLAYPLTAEVELGDVNDWQIEWKWDGIRAQIIKRQGEVFIWSRGEELITQRFPELAVMAEHLPDGSCLDGEIIPWQNENVAPFAQLQRRLGRKTLSKRLLQDIPVVFLAYDLLEFAGNDIRTQVIAERREQLENITRQLVHPQLQLSIIVKGESWEQIAKLRDESHNRRVEGLMLKHIASPYQVGRKRGHWWKWKIDPYTIDAVLVSAQQGHGRRASLYTDYTFALWEGEQLIPFAKAYSGLTDVEIHQVDAFVRRNTLERYGPVRAVKPKLVFELAFEGIALSSRHKSGVAVRFPRILRQRLDKTPDQADTLTTLKVLLDAHTSFT